MRRDCRPCRDIHPDPAVMVKECSYCRRLLTDPKYRKACGLPPLPSPAVRGNPAGSWSKLVTVPPVPDLGLTPTRKRAVVTVATGQKGRDMLGVSGPLMAKYADRLDADHVVLTWEGHPEWPMSAKFAIGETLKFWDRICYLDADVVVRPTALNLFEQCDESEIGACNDLPAVSSLSPNFVPEFIKWRKLMGLPTGVRNPLNYYVNTGVFVASKCHAPVFALPDRPTPAIHLGEQNTFVSRMLDLNVPVKLLPPECNLMYWSTDAFTTGPVPDNAIIHMAGMMRAGHDERMRLMRKWAGVPEPAPVAAGPCAYVGAELTGPEREARKLGHGRRWTFCLHPDKPLGEAVCSCRGCGRGCKGYKAESAAV